MLLVLTLFKRLNFDIDGLIKKRETTKHKEHMYCPIYTGLCPTMPLQKRIGLPFYCHHPRKTVPGAGPNFDSATVKLLNDIRAHHMSSSQIPWYDNCAF